MKRLLIGLSLLLLLLLLTQSVIAMSSSDYKIEWNNLLSGSGGSASIGDYKLDITVGQTVRGTSLNPSYQVQLGFWPGIISPGAKIFLPALKNQ
jgi:hypothetical protein